MVHGLSFVTERLKSLNIMLVVTAQTPDEPYSMQCRESSCLLWKNTPADMLRVYDTVHIQPILFKT